MKPRVLLSLLGFLGVLTAAASGRAAYEFYMTIEGVQTGDFPGESTRLGWEAAIPAVAYYHEVRQPRDASTGQASGKRVHSPVTVTKLWGASSPLIFRALVANERASHRHVRVRGDD